MTSPTDPEVPLHTRLFDAASTLALYAEARAVAPSVVQGARALIERIPALLTEAATTLIGKQALLRQLMDAYSSSGGEGVASLEAIEAAIKLGADPNTKASVIEHKLYKGHCKAGWEAVINLAGLAAYDDALEYVRAVVDSTRRAYEQASGGKTPTVEDLVAAIHRGAR